MAKRQPTALDEVIAVRTAVAREHLLGRKIVEVRYLTANQCDRRMWNHTGIALVLDSGTVLFPVSDAEGNDAGTLHGALMHGEAFVLPELPIP